jgi:hypothetical protein
MEIGVNSFAAIMPALAPAKRQGLGERETVRRRRNSGLRGVGVISLGEYRRPQFLDSAAAVILTAQPLVPKRCDWQAPL